MKQNFSIYIFLCILFLGSAACQDELFYNGGEIGEGESLVSATVNFKPLTPALNGNTRAAGNIIKSINSLCVLLYNEKEELLKTYPLEYAGEEVTTPDEGKYTLIDADRKGNEKTESIGGENKDLPSAESQTPHANFKLTIPYGRYYIYAVANIDDLLTNENYSEAIQTIKGLKSIPLTWDATTIANNNQMFGYFTAMGGSEQNGELAVVNQSTTKLRAWIRRAASKVTVAFDGSRLNDNVYIYIKSVTLKDIPRNCFLEKENKVGEGMANAPSQNEKEEVLWPTGETFIYSNAEDYHNWPAVTAGRRKTLGIEESGKIPSNAATDERLDITKYHTENTPALYFYENIQGTGKDKRQDATGPDGKGDPDGKLDAPGLPGDPEYIEKDDKPYGTYIEVKGYYRAINSEGPITYRFMLGKDVKTDYNAERNHHYKLTLCFNKDANDVDWHIEYRESQEIIAPDPYYISYLYDQNAVLPIRLRGTDFSQYKLKAKIIENNWKPDTDDDVYWKGNVANDGVWHGFLSLAETTEKIIGNDAKYQSDWNMQYWNDHSEKGERSYELEIGSHENTFGNYTIEKSENGIVAQIPFYSRAKQMIPTSGYTGNNPYVAYRRKAKVRISLVDKNTEKEIEGKSTEITIYQVRRCVNPKGVWRSWNNTEDFHVTMKILENEEATSFSTYHSDGPWRAKVETTSPGDNGFVYIDGADKDGYIQGRDDTPMDFKIKFKNECDNPTDVRCAIILVEYNNYTCKHRILIRQGYAPLSLNDSNIKWHTCNMYSKTKETLSPLEEGSLFKFSNWDDAILAENNLREGYGPKEVVNGKKFKMADGTEKSWDEIKSQKTYPAEFTVTDVTNVIGYSNTSTKVRVANADDYDKLRDEKNPNRQFAYGVLYGDGAKETIEKVADVYGYMRSDGESSPKGMRGCFIYNTQTGNNLFFPIGATGNGRRKNDQEWYGYNKKEPGTLQYAFRSELYKDQSTLIYRPIFYDVYKRPGASYWCRKIGESGSKRSFLDINYFSFDFNVGNDECISGTGTSACFIRCVEDVPTTTD